MVALAACQVQAAMGADVTGSPATCLLAARPRGCQLGGQPTGGGAGRQPEREAGGSQPCLLPAAAPAAGSRRSGERFVQPWARLPPAKQRGQQRGGRWHGPVAIHAVWSGGEGWGQVQSWLAVHLAASTRYGGCCSRVAGRHIGTAGCDCVHSQPLMPFSPCLPPSCAADVLPQLADRRQPEPLGDHLHQQPTGG